MSETNYRTRFGRQPIFLLGLCFAAGIIAAKSISVEVSIVAAVSVFSAILAFLIRKYSAATFLIFIAFISIGNLSFQFEQKRENSDDRIRTLYDNGAIRSGSPVEIEGVLLTGPERSVDGEFLTLRAESIRFHGNDKRVSGSVRFFIQRKSDSSGPEISNLNYGSRIRVSCSLEREDSYLNPGVQPKREILDRQGIDATASVKSSMLIEHIADESVFLPLEWVYDQRGKLIDAFSNNLTKPAAGVMIASLLGDKYFLDKDTADLFREGGTFHILVISGLHITFIGGLLLLFMRQITRNRWLQFSVTIGALWAYTLAVGADVPVVRASIMFTIVLFAYAIYRSGTLLNSLGLCGLVLLAWRPSDVFNPSFQLTFVSVGAIVAIAYPLIETLNKIGSWTPTAASPFPPNVPNWLLRFCEMLYWRKDVWAIESKRQIWSANLFKTPYLSNRAGEGVQKIARYVFEGVLVSLIVQICMLPLSVFYFHRVSVGSILLNLWVGIFIAIESFAAVVGAVAGHFSSILATPFYAIADVANWTMLVLPRLISGLNWSGFRLPAYVGMGRTVYFLFFVPIILLALAINKSKPFDMRTPSTFATRRFLFPVSGLLLLFVAVIISHPFSTPRVDGRLHIDFLDVGQGDSALVTFPNGRTMLVDGGGTVNYREKDDESDAFVPDKRSIGEAVVSEVLWAKGYSHIDHILATHADADHIGGLTDIAKNFDIGSAVFGRTPLEDPDYSALADVLKRRKIPVETIARGDVLKFDDATVEVLYPLATGDRNAIYDNDHSVVLRIVYGSRSFLLTGDIERHAESDLINGGGTLEADVIKVPHHGSRTSSTQAFVDAVAPGYAVISVGRTSPFGHPHKDVVERWRTKEVDVMTTGERGMISISTDGKDILVERFLDR